MSLLAHGTISTDPDLPYPIRLAKLFDSLTATTDEWHPDEVAIERVFLKVNRQSAVGAIQASGVAMLVAARRGLEVSEYSAAQVKLAIVGNGAATKDQVSFMVRRLVAADASFRTADSSDAVAVAITHLHSRVGARLQELSR